MTAAPGDSWARCPDREWSLRSSNSPEFCYVLVGFLCLRMHSPTHCLQSGALYTGYREELVAEGSGGYKPPHNNDSEASEASRIIAISAPRSRFVDSVGILGGRGSVRALTHGFGYTRIAQFCTHSVERGLHCGL